MQEIISIHVSIHSLGNVLCECKSSSKEDVDRAVQSAKEAFKVWSEMPALDRGRIMMKAAQKLEVQDDPVTVTLVKLFYEPGITLLHGIS